MLRIQSVKSLSLGLGLRQSYLEGLASRSQSLYGQKTVVKNGKSRTINPPKYELKKIQKRLLENILNKIPVSGYAFGWIPKKSRYGCVEKHVNKKYLYTADIQNFFSSIRPGLIFNLFLQQQCHPKVAKTLLQLTTYDNSLPQGAPTSPKLANILLKNFDNDVGSYWKKRNASYSRFGDDIIVSSNRKISNFEEYTTGKIYSLGLKLNPKKFQNLDRNDRHKVLGLVINHKIDIPKLERKKLKSILYNAKKSGLESQNKEEIPNFREHIAGKIAQIKTCNPKEGEKLWKNFVSID